MTSCPFLQDKMADNAYAGNDVLFGKDFVTNPIVM
jgi:hypothetical protein